MSSPSPMLCHVLREAPELAEAIPAEVRDTAIAECVAPELQFAPGSWQVTAASRQRAQAASWCYRA